MDLLTMGPDDNWCEHCNGYGSSLKESSDRCTECGGSGIIRGDGDCDDNDCDGDCNDASGGS